MHPHPLPLQERPSGLYRLTAYYLARTAADVPIELLNTALFVVIGAPVLLGACCACGRGGGDHA